MKTLYISDLDGTLMDPTPRVTDRSRAILNGLAEKGMIFAAATARTAATVNVLMDGVRTGAPCILMNGACIYDLPRRHYLRVESYPIETILPILRDAGLAGFAFSVRDDRLLTCYERVDTEASRVYMEDRVTRFGKLFTRVPDLAAMGDICYYSVTDTPERLQPARDALRALPGLRVEYYLDVYHPENYYLEIASDRASKAGALRRIREGFDRVVAFGDNYNDLPLFEEADESCAVANARDEVRAAADHVIGANTEDGVALWILENWHA